MHSCVSTGDMLALFQRHGSEEEQISSGRTNHIYFTLKLEKLGLAFSRFNPFHRCHPLQQTAGSDFTEGLNVVLNNKTGP